MTAINGLQVIFCGIEVASGGTIYIPIFMNIGSGIQVISRSLAQQFKTLQGWYYRWSFITIGLGVQKLLGGMYIQAQRRLRDSISLLLFLAYFLILKK
jgi:hypothetical protein